MVFTGTPRLSTLSSAFGALPNNYNAVDKKVQSLEKKVNTLNQELSQLQPGDPQYNKVLTQKNAAEKTLTLSLQKNR